MVNNDRDYSGLPLLKAITSADEDEINQFTRCWIHGGTFGLGDKVYPFLFINGGAATLSSTALGAAVVRDAVTQREVQVLEHTGILGHHVPVMVCSRPA